jgi:hypothetical protein
MDSGSGCALLGQETELFGKMQLLGKPDRVCPVPNRLLKTAHQIEGDQYCHLQADPRIVCVS